MRCPFCQFTDNRVLESRSAESGQSVRRRRECLQCDRRFTTYERIEFVPITVIKRNSDRESFDRSKLLRGVVRACEKSGVPFIELENLVDEIEAELQQRSTREVSSQEIGELVLQRLQGVNEVAYVRFASVYRQFRGIRDFANALHHLQSTSDERKIAGKSGSSTTIEAVSSESENSEAPPSFATHSSEPTFLSEPSSVLRQD
jgi:transcriptional repressor NrdR